MSLDYAAGRAAIAVETLGALDSPLEDRLVHAMTEFIPIRADDLPTEELIGQHQRIIETATKVEPDGDEGSLAATVRQMDEGARQELVGDLVAFLVRVTRTAANNEKS